MNHFKRLLRIAEKILADIHFSTQKEFDEYLKNHPDYREDTKFYVNGVQVKAPPREKNNDSSEMTDEQKRLHQMAMSRDWKGRREVASNPNTSSETLDRLSRDEFDEVRYYVAKNPNTSSEILEKLSGDDNEFVRGKVAENSNTPLETIEKLSNDESDFVRQGVAENPSTPPKILDRLSRDEDENVRESVLYNPNTSLKTLEKLNYDSDFEDEDLDF